MRRHVEALVGRHRRERDDVADVDVLLCARVIGDDRLVGGVRVEHPPSDDDRAVDLLQELAVHRDEEQITLELERSLFTTVWCCKAVQRRFRCPWTK